MGLIKGLSIGLLFTFVAQAADKVPPCMAGGKEFGPNNLQILEWKARTKNSFVARGHILGRLVRRYSNKNGHSHFSVLIGKTPTDTIEVIYNESFGETPPLTAGAVVEACGDYITSNQPSGPYPASPDGAIIHWVHFNPGVRGHEDGYVVVNGKLTGQTKPKN